MGQFCHDYLKQTQLKLTFETSANCETQGQLRIDIRINYDSNNVIWNNQIQLNLSSLPSRPFSPS